MTTRRSPRALIGTLVIPAVLVLAALVVAALPARAQTVLDVLGSLVGLAATLVVGWLFLVADDERVARSVSTRQLRRRLRRAEVRPPGADAAPLERSLDGALVEALVAQDLGVPRTPGAVISSALAHTDRTAVHWWPQDLAALRDALGSASRPTREDPLARILAPTRTRDLADDLEATVSLVDEHLNQEGTWRTVHARDAVALAGAADDPALRDEAGRAPLFADMVSALTGALVVADATASRSSSAHRIMDWHVMRFSPRAPEAQDAVTFADHHPSQGRLHSQRSEHGHQGGSAAGGAEIVPCAWSTKLRHQKQTHVDDYDGRVALLHGAALMRDRRTGHVNLMVQTSDSCHAATEVSPARCKHLPTGAAIDTAPLWCRESADASGMSLRRAQEVSAAVRGTPGIQSLLTSFTLLISQGDALAAAPGTPRMAKIVLLRRSQANHNNAAVLSCPGGVLNLAIDDVAMDEDASGQCSPTSAIRRELHEELGVDLAEDAFEPRAIFVLNQRGPWIPGTASAGLAPQTGELVATVLHVATVHETVAEIRRASLEDSESQGRYELSHLETIDLPIVDEESGIDAERAAAMFAATVREHAEDLDQRAVIGCLYTAAERYGIERTVAAFTAAFEVPWDCLPWSREYDVHPGAERSTVPVESLADGDWGRVIAALRVRLGAVHPAQDASHDGTC